MDTTRFDRIAKTFAQKPERRDVLRLLGVAALGVSSLSLLGTAEAKKKHKRKKHKKKKKGANCNGKCGGECPRCSAGSSCDDRAECTTALCDGGICTEPVINDDCGLDTDGNGCFRREHEGEHFCSRQQCRSVADGVSSCADCVGKEVCAPAGVDFECCQLCGSPL